MRFLHKGYMFQIDFFYPGQAWGVLKQKPLHKGGVNATNVLVIFTKNVSFLVTDRDLVSLL